MTDAPEHAAPDEIPQCSVREFLESELRWYKAMVALDPNEADHLHEFLADIEARLAALDE